MNARWIAVSFLALSCALLGVTVDVYPVAAFPPFVSSPSDYHKGIAPFEVDFPFKGMLLANLAVEGNIHCLVTPVKADLVKIEFSSPSLSVNNRTFRNVKGELVMNKESVLIRRVELENLLLSGKIETQRNELTLEIELKSTSIENIFALFNARPVLIGKTVGKATIEGPFDALTYKGYIYTENGMIKNIAFKEAMFHFNGSFPFCFIDNSYINIDDVKYTVEGTLGVRELANLDKVSMTIMPEKLVIDGWNITQRDYKDSDNVVFSKKGGSDFRIDFNEKGDVTDDSTHMGVEFKKTLGVDKFLRFKANDNKSSLVVGKEVEF